MRESLSVSNKLNSFILSLSFLPATSIDKFASQSILSWCGSKINKLLRNLFLITPLQITRGNKFKNFLWCCFTCLFPGQDRRVPVGSGVLSCHGYIRTSSSSSSSSSPSIHSDFIIDCEFHIKSNQMPFCIYQKLFCSRMWDTFPTFLILAQGYPNHPFS